jgi:hypothetical protein
MTDAFQTSGTSPGAKTNRFCASGSSPTLFDSFRTPSSVISSEAIPNLAGELSSFAREHLARFLSIPNKCFIRVLYGAPKTILHGNDDRRMCQILQTHENLREIQPLVELGEGGLRESKAAPFWVPRRAADKKTFFHARRKRKGFRPPNWSGETRPANAMTVPLATVSVHPLYWAKLREFVFDPNTSDEYLMLGFPRSYFPRSEQRPKPRRTEHTKFNSNGWFAKEVTRAIAQHRWGDSFSSAVFEVLYLERKPRAVAEERGLPIKTVYEYCSRVRKNLPPPRAAETDFTIEGLLAEAIYGL